MNLSKNPENHNFGVFVTYKYLILLYVKIPKMGQLDFFDRFYRMHKNYESLII